ncbi:MAG: cell division protein [Archaeoglobaceae archaeon]
MRLLTIGVGLRGAKIVELFYKEGVRVNGVPLFKCFVVLSDDAQLRSIGMKDNRKFYLHSSKGVGGFINAITRVYELWEGSLVVTSLEDEFGFQTSLEICEKIKSFSDDPMMYLTLIPTLGEVDIREIKRKISQIRKIVDVLILFEGKGDVDRKILSSLNLLALAGEVDIKKRVAGEVVVDTSDVFNSLKIEGFSVIGFAEKQIPQINFELFKKKVELKAIRTRRLLELLDSAMENLSISCNIENAKSALLLFCGPQEELTMEGIFEAISKLETLNSEIVVRYGDCPLPRKKISLISLFSGIKSFKF